MISKEYTNTCYYFAGRVLERKYKDYKQFTLINASVNNTNIIPAKTLNEASKGSQALNTTTPSFFNKDKVVGLDIFDEELSDILKLDNNFSLT